MKTYQERTENITSKAKGIVSRRRAWITVTATLCLVAIVCVGIFLPISDEIMPTDISAYKNDVYYPLIQKINAYNSYNPPLILEKDDMNEITSQIPTSPAPDASAPGAGDDVSSQPDVSTPTYEETTLNQVEGVVEGDIVKRTQTHAFSLQLVKNYYETNSSKNCNTQIVVRAYSLQKEKSEVVGKYDTEIDVGFNYYYYYYNNAEMYLSEDGGLATILTNFYKEGTAYTCLISLDISDPANITEKGRTFIAGTYKSSRKVNGEILVVTNFSVPYIINYDNKISYVPSSGTENDIQCFDMQEIYIPENVTNCSYTVVAKVQEKSLEISDKQALFSFAKEVAVSTEHIFVVRNGSCFGGIDGVFYDEVSVNAGTSSIYYTDIVALTYKDSIETVGCVRVDGTIKDRYSLDEKAGILRVVTTTSTYSCSPQLLYYDNGIPQYGNSVKLVTNASLFCIDLQSMEVVASKENFAPDGEAVQAVRFNGDMAYVCTAVRFTDPVFAFDLSDLSNITVQDTGTISGYSISLLPFGDKLLGIGYGENSGELKIELYQETENGVQSVCSYSNAYCSFSTEYKAHFVDSERQLVGLMVYDYSNFDDNCGYYYLLLHFNGEKFEKVLFVEISDGGDLSQARAFYADGLYVIAPNDFVIKYFDIDAIMQNMTNSDVAE